MKTKQASIWGGLFKCRLNKVCPVFFFLKRGSKCISLSTEVYITFADLFLDQSKSCIQSWYTIYKYINIIPHLILSFIMLFNSSGRCIAIVCVILITPAAPVVICTKYGPGKWHSTIYLKMHILRHCFVQCGIDFISFTINSKQHNGVRQRYLHSVRYNKSRSEPGNAPRIDIGHREVVCQKYL